MSIPASIDRRTDTQPTLEGDIDMQRFNPLTISLLVAASAVLAAGFTMANAHAAIVAARRG